MSDVLHLLMDRMDTPISEMLLVGDGAKSTMPSLLLRSESRRPRRAYAAEHLWAASSATALELRRTHV